MEVKDCETILVFLFSVFCVSNSSVLSGLAGFGFIPLQNDVCNRNISDQRTCYVTVATNISCFTAELRFGACKTQAGTFLSDDTVIANKPRNLTALQAYYHRLNGGRHRQGIVGSCVELSQGNCTQYSCMKKCCVGWEMDSSDQCTKPTSSKCQNGGNYNWMMRRQCMCKQGFSGNHCEIALCQDECLNGGQCLPTSAGNNVCECPSHASGSHCQYVHCPQTCENGGYCISDGPLPTCKCLPGFYGKTCSHTYRGDTVCPPPINTLCTDLSCRDECAADKECLSDQVCCTDGCCMKCVNPKPPGCKHNGFLHEPRSTFRKDNCTECLCQINGSTTCLNVNDYCCSHDCREDKTHKRQGTLISHKMPTINCSKGIKVVPVNRYSSVAYMNNLKIRAKDQNGHQLKVFYSPTYVSHDRTPRAIRDAVLIKASARDVFGYKATCFQAVFVVDRTPPRVLLCPSDIYAKENELVSWREPRASDNVGIRSLHGNYKPRSIFQSGLTTVVYTASDYDGNKAFCKFSIHVTKTQADTTPPIFLSCPSAIHGNEDEPVSWEEPGALDNYSICSFVSTHHSNSFFPLGLTLVVYTATDCSNNKAYCRFNVYITQKDTGIRDYPESSGSHMTDAVKITVGSLSSLLSVLIIVIVAVIICRRYRSKRAKRTSSRRQGNQQVPIQTISNSLYEGMDEVFNGTIVPTLKPPPYSPATDPPTYDEVFSHSGTRNTARNENLPAQPPAYES